ncbi:MAG: GntR family transcriptional regulator [Burkholderiales bacterium]|nr:GntR family transcriptional regulator [Burkholderiales bacterium]
MSGRSRRPRAGPQPNRAARAAAASPGKDGAADITACATQQDACYQRLRQWVTVGRFLPGERLKIRAVAAELGVGLMPVRAALQRLAAEGALVNVPNAGVAVPLLTGPEFDDVLDMRLLLEGEAAERGALRAQRGDLAVLRALGQRMAAALEAPDAKAYLAANEDFHRHLYRAAGSPTLLALIETVWLKVGPLSNRLFDHPQAVAVLNEAHDDVLAALARRDGAAVRRAIERDLFVAGQFLRLACRVR